MNALSKSVIASAIIASVVSGAAVATDPGIGAFYDCIEQKWASDPASAGDCRVHFEAIFPCLTSTDEGRTGYDYWAFVDAVVLWVNLIYYTLMLDGILIPDYDVRSGGWGVSSHKVTCIL